MGSQNQFQSNSRMILISVVSYWVVSISMVFLNKYLLSSPDLHLNAPFFITWWQCVIGVVCSYFMQFMSQEGTLFDFPQFELQPNRIFKSLPLSVIFTGMIVFNNLCLKFVGVAFYTVTRSLTTVFNVILTFILLGQTTSVNALMCCSIIVIGFFLGVDQEFTAPLVGVIFGVCSSIFVALYSIYVKKVLPDMDDNSWRLMLYNNFNSSFLFLPLILFSGETKLIYENLNSVLTLYFWTMMSLGGIFGVLIGFVTMLQIKFTTPLTHNVSATAKACAQTVMAVLIYSEVKSPLWWLSNFLVLFGSGAYTTVRRAEMEREKNENIKYETDDDDNEEENDGIENIKDSKA